MCINSEQTMYTCPFLPLRASLTQPMLLGIVWIVHSILWLWRALTHYGASSPWGRPDSIIQKWGWGHNQQNVLCNIYQAKENILCHVSAISKPIVFKFYTFYTYLLHLLFTICTLTFYTFYTYSLHLICILVTLVTHYTYFLHFLHLLFTVTFNTFSITFYTFYT